LGWASRSTIYAQNLINIIVKETYSQCKFCGKTESEVSSLKKGAGIAICNVCITDLYDKLEETDKIIFQSNECCFCNANKSDSLPLVTDNNIAVCCQCIEEGAINLIKDGFPMDKIELSENIKGCHSKITKDDVFSILNNISIAYLELDALKLAATLSFKLKIVSNIKEDTNFDKIYKNRRDLINNIRTSKKLMSVYEKYSIALVKTIRNSDSLWEIECSLDITLLDVTSKSRNIESKIGLIIVIEGGFIVVSTIKYIN